jgi:hypothetical protein
LHFLILMIVNLDFLIDIKTISIDESGKIVKNIN